MKASVGDRIVIASNQLDRPVRDGEIVEVRGELGGPPYLVRWSDSGHEGLFYPGPDAHVEHHLEPEAGVPAPRPEAGQPGHVRTWRVEVQIFEAGDDTSARAVLLAESPMPIEARGRAHRNPHDRSVPEIGDEVAVARALRRLADQLLSTAAADIADVEGHPVQLPR
jgi:hypothetical protein